MKRFAMLMVALSVFATAQAAYGYAAKMPSATLADPRGVKHSLKAPMVILITAPTYHAEHPQESWDNALEKAMPKGGNFVMLEDMSVSHFKGIAKKDMKKDWKGPPPLLLIDETGNTRKAFGVGGDETVVLVYDKGGKLVHSNAGGACAAAAQAAWAKYK